MIRIAFKSEPAWLDLPLGVRVLVRPQGTSVIVAAGGDIGDDRAQGNFVRAMARAAIVEWEGVGDSDDCDLDVTPQAVNALMEIWPIYEAFQRLYVTPSMMVSAEGNA